MVSLLLLTAGFPHAANVRCLLIDEYRLPGFGTCASHREKADNVEYEPDESFRNFCARRMLMATKQLLVFHVSPKTSETCRIHRGCQSSLWQTCRTTKDGENPVILAYSPVQSIMVFKVHSTITRMNTSIIFLLPTLDLRLQFVLASKI